MTSKSERGVWLRERCYRCGHWLRFPSTACPQCGENFHGRMMKQYPERSARENGTWKAYADLGKKDQ